MMSPDYVNGMCLVREDVDFQRNLKIGLYRPVGGKEDNPHLMDTLRFEALTHWHEAGCPDAAVFHLGGFVKVERIQ